MVRQLSDSACNEVRDGVKAFLSARPDLCVTDITAHTTLAESTGRAYLAGNIPGGRQVVGEFRRVLELARAGDILQPGGRRNASVLTEDTAKRVRRVRKQANFYETQTVKKVAEVLDYCAEHCAIGVITADFGVGKTEAVNAWRRDRKDTDSVVWEFDVFSCGNAVDCVRSLARQFGLNYAMASWNGGVIFRDLCDYLREHPCLLVFDQCDQVRVKVFQAIRQVWDRTHDAGVGVVLLSAPILLSRMNQSRVADLGALTSRVSIWAPLTGVTKAEMAAIVKAEGITDIDEAAFDLWCKATAGSMRRLMRAVDLIKAKHAGKRVTERTIAGVAGHLWGMNLDVSL